MRRRVLLHLGLPKTGSTALQAALFLNREFLGTLGVMYPSAQADDWRAKHGRGTSGNGVTILGLITDRGAPSHAARVDTIHRIRAEARDFRTRMVVYSSESMFAFRLESVAELADALRVHEIDLHVVVYVRDIAGHTVSAYAEHVKRRLYTGSLSDYVAQPPDFMGFGVNFHRRLEGLLEVLGRDSVHVRHFDSERHQLVETFAREELGVADLSNFIIPDGIQNRTLTTHELALMRHANEQLGSRQLAQRIGEAFIAREPVGPKSLTLTNQEMSRLQEHFGSAVQWVDERFFSGTGRLTVYGGATVAGRPSEPRISPQEAFLVDCMVDLVEAEEHAQNG